MRAPWGAVALAASMVFVGVLGSFPFGALADRWRRITLLTIAMLVWTNGRERKLSEFAALFKAAGLKLERVTENPAGQSVVEAVAGV